MEWSQVNLKLFTRQSIVREEASDSIWSLRTKTPQQVLAFFLIRVDRGKHCVIYRLESSFMYTKKKPGSKPGWYMNGLVSTGNKFPYTILKILFSNTKILSNYFIHNFIFIVLIRDVDAVM